ncbi:IS3 family transposase [Thermus thermophilus]|uniref:Transposase n=1 Tax=Thermus thermophilus TaxID=274 RepID=A0A7R7TGH4_THETH|nr:IS3 family transposase [Thermus thermophilus]BCP66508.1 transposase [Thermus thermophilus]BCP66524.1 transposase [Thermus thermophilus]BCP66912.1 transposase [Thermus thermophilus]BCP66987.1 transposase [Thermus thermophilus]BCP67285.1 transposase [Thermus thermophilus]
MTLGERIDLAREALAQGLAPLPIVLSALEIPRATWYYYRKQKVEADRKREEEDLRLKRAIEEVLLEHPEYGYRRIGQELRRRGLTVNHKRIHRLLQDFHLSLKRTARKPKPNPLLQIVLLAGDKADLRAFLLKQREPEPFELLYTDFTLLPYRGGKAWFVPILDHRTRTVVAWGLGPSPSAELALEAWEEAKAFFQAQVGRFPKALVHHDQGGPFLSHDWVGTLLLRDGQRLSYSLMGAKGNPTMESFFARFKGEGRDQFLEARSLEELRGVVKERLAYYHEGRLHSGLGYRTPREVMEEALGQSKQDITREAG